MMMVADDDSLQDWTADHVWEGQERAARDGGDRGVVMMAAVKLVVAEDSSSGQQRQRRQTKWWQMTTARKIRWQPMNGKVKSGRQTMAELGIK
jgi:hypothetical protein